MFGSPKAFGQSLSSPFGSQLVFGSNNASNDPFSPKPFGSPTPFGSQTGGSIFGGTSTGVFGAAQSSVQLGSTTFGASSTPAFGGSAFGASSTPAFGSSSSSFGGSSIFGQKPSFGGFGSTPSQASPFGSTQQTQSTFGSNTFGYTSPFGASNQPAFGSTSTPAFGMSGTPAFGGSSTPTFGATSASAVTTPTVGSSSAFGSGGPFGASSTPAFGSSNSPSFGASSTAFGASSSPSIGQSNSAFGSSPFGTTSSPFGAQSSSFGSQATVPSSSGTAFGQSNLGGQRGGSRVAGYSPTAEIDGGSSTQAAAKLKSVSAMPAYKDKSHEELRWEDYQLGDKGGPSSAAQTAGGISFGAPSSQSNPFGASTTFGQSSSNPFSSTTRSNPSAPKTSTPATSVFGAQSTSTFSSSPFGSSSTTNPFGATLSTTSSPFATSTGFGASSSPSIFGASSSPAFSSSPSIFGSTAASGTSFGSGLNFGNTQSAGLFQSTTPSLGPTNSGFGQTSSAFGQNTPSFGQTNIVSPPSTGFGFSGSSTPSLLPTYNQPTVSNAFQIVQPAQTSGSFSLSNFGQTQTAPGSFGGMTGGFGQSPNPVVLQPTAVSNPFGTLPAMPQMSIGRSGPSPTVQYGISSMPVTDKPNPVRLSSLMTSRHLSQRRIGSTAKMYHPKNDSPKVPFYYDDEAPSTPKADALFIQSENPRALVIRPNEKWPSRASFEKPSMLKDTDGSVHQNGGHAENGSDKKHILCAKRSEGSNGGHENHSTQKADSYIARTRHRAGEAAIVSEHEANIEVVMPKLKHADYYTEPRIQELAAKERAEPGFCQHVKDFVVGRQGYGSIRFEGETDVRGLDLESIVQFNNREVIVYMDDKRNPPVGHGLNKPAEVTLLNIKCFDKKTEQQYTEGPKVEKYIEMLMRKALDQGAEFASYDPLKGEWRFRVKHFSRYSLEVHDAELDVHSSEFLCSPQ